VNAGTSWSGEDKVVVVDGGTGPVKDSTNVSYAEPVSVKPTATHSVALTHDTDASSSSLVPGLGLGIIDHSVPFQTITNVSYAEPLSV